MNLSSIRKKARDGSLEVEHLLLAAVKRLPGLSEELTQLAKAYHWQDQGLQPDGRRVVPFAKWSEVAAAYANDEFNGLRALAQEPENVGFVLGLAEEVKTSASVAFVLEICGTFMANLAHSEEAAFRLARTLNLLLSFKQAPPITASQARLAQDFLLALYPYAESEADRALVLLALRGVGNSEAIRFVEAAEAFGEPWVGTKESVLRAIRKRASANAL